MATTPDPTAARDRVTALAEDMTTPPDLRTGEGELRYYADGTAVVMRWKHGERRGVAVGFTPGDLHGWQVVEWPDGTRDNVAPHVLHRADGASFGQAG